MKRNAPTKLMKELGYGAGYQYAHDYKDNIVEQEHLPLQLKGKRYYIPSERGFEKVIKKRMADREKRELELRQKKDNNDTITNNKY